MPFRGFPACIREDSQSNSILLAYLRFLSIFSICYAVLRQNGCATPYASDMAFQARGELFAHFQSPHSPRLPEYGLNNASSCFVHTRPACICWKHFVSSQSHFNTISYVFRNS